MQNEITVENLDSMNTWVEIKEYAPIKLDRVVYYGRLFESQVGVKISQNNLDKAKKSLLEARGSLDLMITTLHQLLYDRKILKEKTDEVIYMWMVDNLGRYQKRLDQNEEDLIISSDNPNQGLSNVGVSRLSTYAKLLKLSSTSIVFETLIKSIKEYYSFEEEENIKREPRTFLYILFQILSVTLSSLGGITREEKKIGQKGSFNTFPGGWKGLMEKPGQEGIKEGYKEETGQDIEIPEFMREGHDDSEN